MARRKHTPTLDEQRDTERASYLLRVYKITIEQFDEMVRLQGGKCGICETTEPGSAGNSWHVDHDHRTGRVRGLLCLACNSGLGKMGDTVEGLERAIRYLQRTDFDGRKLSKGLWANLLGREAFKIKPPPGRAERVAGKKATDG